MESFQYFGASFGDVVLNAAFAFSTNVETEIDLIDRNIVFLSKFANLSAEWVEAQDVVRQNRLVRITMDFMDTQKTTVAFDDDDNEPPS